MSDPNARLSMSQIPLGVEKGSRVSVDWIGFASPTEHSAVRAESNQAAFSRAHGNDGGASASKEPKKPQPPQQESRSDPVQKVLSKEQALSPVPNESERQSPTQQSAQESTPQEKARPAQRPGAPGQTADPDAKQLKGALSDKESSATSRDKTLEFQPGQPLARKGLEIKTVLPEFSVLTRITSGKIRKDPIVTLRFGRSGHVIRVTFKEGTLTGNPAIDEPIRNAVTSWTAKGKEIDAIPKRPRTAGVDVTIRLKL